MQEIDLSTNFVVLGVTKDTMIVRGNKKVGTTVLKPLGSLRTNLKTQWRKNFRG